MVKTAYLVYTPLEAEKIFKPVHMGITTIPELEGGKTHVDHR